MPEKLDACVESVLEDNPSYSEDRAYAICQAMRNRGELGLSEDASHDELLAALAESDFDCPEGKVRAGQTCVEVEEVNAPPSLLNSSPVFQLEALRTEPIERTEEGDNKVRYSNVKLISPGVWTDSGSRETVWYSPKGMRGLEVSEDNSVNIMHDENNDVSRAGYIDPDSIHQSDEGVFGDLVIDTSNAAGQYADENLQETLESGGARGFGGPSVEIAAEGQQVEFNEEKGMRELLGGIISGLGLVKNPAAKSVSFARQTAQRGVALSDGSQSVMRLSTEPTGMSGLNRSAFLEAFGYSKDDLDLEDDRSLADVPVQELVSLIAESYDADPAELMSALEPFLDDNEEERENQEDDEDDDEEMPEEDGEEEKEDEEMDMAERVSAIEERLGNVEDMMESAMAAEDVEETLSEELEEAKQDLADAETVQELSEAKDDLEKRLSELEEQPKTPRSLSDNSESEEYEGEVRPASVVDRASGSIKR